MKVKYRIRYKDSEVYSFGGDLEAMTYNTKEAANLERLAEPNWRELEVEAFSEIQQAPRHELDLDDAEIDQLYADSEWCQGSFIYRLSEWVTTSGVNFILYVLGNQLWQKVVTWQPPYEG